MLPASCAEDEDDKLVLADASSACYQAPVGVGPDGKKPVMRPPLDLVPKTKLWEVQRAMPGMRDAGRSWQDHQSTTFCEKGGFRRALG